MSAEVSRRVPRSCIHRLRRVSRNWVIAVAQEGSRMPLLISSRAS